MGVRITDRITTVGPSDVYATGDANRQALGFHAVDSLVERNQIPYDRRRGTYQVEGEPPKPFFVAVRTGTDVKLYWLKNEPGDGNTTNSDWQEFIPTPLDPFQGFFVPSSATMANGTGTKGHYWIASVSGTFNGETYAQYDKSIYDGTTWKKAGGGSVVGDWNTLINKPSTFTPTTHTHAISQVSGLQTELDNKVSSTSIIQNITDEGGKIPSAHAVVDYTYSKAETDSKLSNLSTYGIKFSWLNLSQMNTQTGQILGDLGLRQDEQKVYKWTGTAWSYFFTVDPNGVRINDTTPSTTTAYSGTKIEDRITNHDHTTANSSDNGFMSNTNFSKLKALPTKNSTTIEIVEPPILSINGSNILSATSGSVKEAGGTYTVPAVSTIGGVAVPSSHLGKYFYGIIFKNSPGSYSTTYFVYNNLDSLPDLFPDGYAYFGLYKYVSSGVIEEVSYNYPTKVKFPDGTTKIVKANGVLDLSSLSSGGTATTNASDLISGTLNDARLSSNVPLKNTYVEWTQEHSYIRSNPHAVIFSSNKPGYTGRPWYELQIDGTMSWGNGTDDMDTTLSRTGAGIVEASGKINALGGLQENGTDLSSKYALTGHTHSADDITAGTLADARLSSNVPLFDTYAEFSQGLAIDTPYTYPVHYFHFYVARRGGGGIEGGNLLTVDGYGKVNAKVELQEGGIPINTKYGIVYKTGAFIDFRAAETEFGTEDTPVTGNITADPVGAVVGHMAFMIHNSGTAPTFGSEFHKIAGSGDYVLSVKNYIYFDYRSSSRINYSITQ